MYDHILVPVIFDKGHNPSRSFEAARALASEGAKLTVLHVMEEIPAYAATQIPAEVLENSRAQTRQALAEKAAGLPGAEAVMISGHAGRAIVDYAEEHAVDCIIMASHKPGLEDYFLGSTADRVVRHASCSVNVIR